jgi:ribonuclease-3
MDEADFSGLENRIGYVFSDKALLRQAFIHASADLGTSYERLEFLGDAVLELIISEYVFSQKPELPEGMLTKNRAALVSEVSLAEAARALGLAEFLILGKGERSSGGADKPSILADVTEAMIGAVYLDGGLNAARPMVERILSARIEEVFSGGGVRDYKTRLQERWHKKGVSDIRYVVYKEEGPPHERTFYVKLMISGEEVARGKGRSKKAAEQKAARQAYMAAEKQE